MQISEQIYAYLSNEKFMNTNKSRMYEGLVDTTTAGKRSKIRQETQQALTDLKTNRLLSSEEVMRWLETWGTANEIEAPKL